MKKLLSLLLAVSLVMTGLVFAPVASADMADPNAIAVPSTWELIGEESFIREPVDNGDGTTTTDFDPTATSFSALYTSAVTEQAGVDYAYVNNEGLNICTASTKAYNSVALTLSDNAKIDLSTPADYYIIYDINPWKKNERPNPSLNLYNSTDDTKKLTYYHKKRDTSVSNSMYPFTIAVLNNTTETISNYSTDYEFGNHYDKWFRTVTQISSRSDGTILTRTRWFDISGADAELPTVTPAYWEAALRINKDQIGADVLDTIQFRTYRYSKAGYLDKIKNLKIYKSSPLNSYSTPMTDASGNALNVANYTTDAVVSTANTPYTMTMDAVPAGCELVSQGWYDYSDENSPVLLAEGASIDVPQSMRGKLLKAVRVIKENGVEVTYTPFVGKVRDVVDFYINPAEQNPDRYPFKSALPGIKVSNKDATTNTRVGNATYDIWQTATSFKATVHFNVNANVSTDDGILALILAQYDKDGMLKRVATPSPDNANTKTGIGVIGAYKSRTHNTLSVTMDSLSVEAGDYFKPYLWKTTSTPATVDGKTYYNFQQITPIDYSATAEAAKDYNFTDPIATVPEATE